MQQSISRCLPLVLAVVLFGVVLLLAGCSAADKAQSTADGTNGSDGTADLAGTPTTEEEPLFVPTYVPNGNESAVITTDKGVIRIRFQFDEAPVHVASFIELARKGFFDGTKFHRVEPGFVIQGGDPLSRNDDPMVGTGGPGYRIAAEFNSLQHLDGTVSMARSQDPDSAGSQFFICLGPQPFLDGQYTVFGQVTEGLDVVHSITKNDVMRAVTIENATE